MEPLIFVEVALTDRLADNVQALLDENAPVFDAGRADTAIFYSISNTQAGLRGVSFGNFLLKRVIDDLQRDFPKLSHFATLSPLPGFAAWVREESRGTGGRASNSPLAQLAAGEWRQDAGAARRINEALSRLAARYLTLAKAGRGDGRCRWTPWRASIWATARASSASIRRRFFRQGFAAVLRRDGELPVRPRRAGAERRKLCPRGRHRHLGRRPAAGAAKNKTKRGDNHATHFPEMHTCRRQSGPWPWAWQRTPLLAQTKTIKISHQFPGGTIDEGDFRDRLVRKFAAEVEKKSGGALKFEIYPASSLMKPVPQWGAVHRLRWTCRCIRWPMPAASFPSQPRP
jgi:hypothetical protein